MDATPAATRYVTILDRCEGGTFWLQVQLPAGPLARGPYHTREEARGAAVALERVARRRWAQYEPRRPAGAPIGGPARKPSITAGEGTESPEKPPNRPDISRFPGIWARFRPRST